MNRAVRAILKGLLWLAMGVVLFVSAVVLLLYSSWAQEKIRLTAVALLNAQPGMEARLDKFSLGAPLCLDIEGLMLAQDGDTLVAADRMRADISPLPLLIGEVGVSGLSANGLRYQMGNADSLMMMVIKADTIDIAPASVKLSPMRITIDDGRLSHASVMLSSKPDTVAKPSSESMDMAINISRLELSDFSYVMAMEPIIDSLGATIGQGELRDAHIDLKAQTITLKDFFGNGLQAAYIAAPATVESPAAAAPADTAQSAPWTIKIDSIAFENSQALYTTKGYEPQPGLDFGYIQASDMSLQIKDFYNQAANITLPLKLRATERCGLTLDAGGTFAMADGKMLIQDFDIATAASRLKADGYMGLGGDIDTAAVQMAASGSLGIDDVRLMFPIAKPYLLGFKDDAIDLRLALAGSMANLAIDTAEIAIGGVARLNAQGRVANMMDPNDISGYLDFGGSIGDARAALRPLLDGTGVELPPLTLDGKAEMDRGAIDARLTAATRQGRLALDAKYNGRIESYDVSVNANKFPVQAFMPKMGVGRVTAKLAAKGRGFDLFSPRTRADVSLAAPSVEYNGYDYTGVSLTASLSDGKGNVAASVKNTDVDANIQAQGNLAGAEYAWTLGLEGHRIDLKAINMTAEPATLSVSLDAKATVSSDMANINAEAQLRDLKFDTGAKSYDISDVNARFSTADSLTTLAITNRDLHANAELPCGLDTIMARATRATALLDAQMAEKQLHADTLQKTLPQFAFTLEAGSDNLINDILREHLMQVGRVHIAADNAATLSLTGQATSIFSGNTRIDTANVSITQRGDKLNLLFTVDNRPGNLEEFAHVRLNGIFNTNQLALRASQKNSQGATGYDLGAIVALADSTINARVFPLTPTIGYKPWTVNFDNFITYHIPTKRIDANLRMSGEKSSLALYTEPSPDSLSNDIVLKIDDLRLQDWLAINPFAPQIEGDLSADMRLRWNGGADIEGNGNITLADLIYNRERVGTFGIGMDVSTNTAGMVRAKADLSVDGVKTATIAGNLNDSTALSPFNLDFSVIKFPLAVANPFLPEGTGRLTGTLNGEMLISGDSGQPIINGEIYFDQAALKLDMTNTSYAFSDVRIPVVDNLVTFNDFAVSGANENPLRLNGHVDLKSVSAPSYDLKLNAKNMMVVNTKAASKGASIFGKAYIDLDATAKGNMKFMAVKANLAVLSGTNVTYALTMDANTLQSPAENDMVKFVNFTDTAMVARADSLTSDEMAMMLTAQLAIQSGVTVVVDLPTSARDKVQIQPQGTVNYTQMPMGDGRLTGRINLNSGFARYTIPVVGAEKEFTIDPDSYIAFNGDMLNPILNLKAVDDVRANVTQSGQNSRLIDFDIILDVTGTLETMNVKFDLSTNDDLTVANELQSMTAEQRANQAMNLLLYNMYTGPGTKGSANLSGNPLFSFLESQVNNWAANNIKGVDLSFGIDQYDQTTNGSTSQTMTYSYQVSKTLFNDRFKIVVGGNYSSNADAEENLSQNLINDISFEYYLNNQQTMLVKLFRHTGYESILEGEITQTGVGFVYRRKISHLAQALPKFMRPKRFRTVK